MSILYDRSRTVTDWFCPRARYLQYEVDGTGIVGSNTSLELLMGTAVHDGLAAIAFQHHGGPLVNIDQIADVASASVYDALMQASLGDDESHTFAKEQSTLVEGLLRGFYKQVWSTLMATYPVIKCIEQEMVYTHGHEGDPLTFMSRPDLVLQDPEGLNWYVEYKTTSSKKDGWMNQWPMAVQLHSTIKAVEATIGEPVAGVIIQGLYKGFESYGKQSSPFCYAYHRNANPPFVSEEWSYDYKAGFKRFPTWEMPGGVKAWIDAMPANVLADQFPQVPPIFIKDELVDNFFSQRMVREREIKLALDVMEGADDAGKKAVMDIAFPQFFDKCHSYYGKVCQFARICHGNVDNPLQEGYVPREPHHQLEMDAFKASDDVV